MELAETTSHGGLQDTLGQFANALVMSSSFFPVFKKMGSSGFLRLQTCSCFVFAVAFRPWPCKFVALKCRETELQLPPPMAKQPRASLSVPHPSLGILAVVKKCSTSVSRWRSEKGESCKNLQSSKTAVPRAFRMQSFLGVLSVQVFLLISITLINQDLLLSTRSLCHYVLNPQLSSLIP